MMKQKCSLFRSIWLFLEKSRQVALFMVCRFHRQQPYLFIAVFACVVAVRNVARTNIARQMPTEPSLNVYHSLAPSKIFLDL